MLSTEDTEYRKVKSTILSPFASPLSLLSCALLLFLSPWSGPAGPRCALQVEAIVPTFLDDQVPRLVNSMLCYATAGTWHTEIKAVRGFGPALSDRTPLCHPLHAVIPPQPAGWLSPVSGWSFWRFYSSNPYSFLRTERLSLKLDHLR